jgi:hypothetical protein
MLCKSDSEQYEEAQLGFYREMNISEVERLKEQQIITEIKDSLFKNLIILPGVTNVKK